MLLPEDTSGLDGFCVEAAHWLSGHRSELVASACCELLGMGGGESIEEDRRPKMSSEDLQKFSRDLEFYLTWIGHFMARKLNPRPFEVGSVFLPVEYRHYVDAFELMKRSDVVRNSGLSDDAINALCNYINRFLIDAENQPVDCHAVKCMLRQTK